MTSFSAVISTWQRLGPAGAVFAARAAALSASLVTVLLTSRALGAEGRGVIATFGVVQLLGAVGLGLGTGAAAYVFISRDSRVAPGVAAALLAWTAVVATATIGLVGAAQSTGLLGPWFSGVAGPLPLLLGMGAAGQYLALACTQLAMGLSRTHYTAAGFAIPPVVVMLGAVLATAVSPEPDTYLLVLAGGWATAGALLFAGLRIWPAFDLRTLAALVQTGRAAAVGECANALSYRLDTLILGLLGGIGAVGIYSLAVQVLEPLWIVATSASSGLLIQYGAVKPGQWVAITRRSARVAGALTSVGVLLVLAVLPMLISFVGRQFQPSIFAAWALGPGTVFLSVSKVLAAYQVGSGRLWLGSAVASVSLAVTTGFDLILIPPLGATGAAIASSVGYGVSTVLWLIAFRRYSFQSPSGPAGAREAAV